MSSLDIIILVLFIPALVQGISKGFVEQIVNIAAILIGGYLANLFSATAAKMLAPHFHSADPKIVQILCFAVILILAIVLLSLLGRGITKAINSLSLSWVNRLLGVVLSVFTTALVLGLLIHVFNGINAKLMLVKPELINESNLYAMIQSFSEKVFPFLKNLLIGHV